MVKDKPYSQAHQPISEQQTAIGHAVRFVYLMTGVAHLARLSQDEGKSGLPASVEKHGPAPVVHYRRDRFTKQRRGV
jgi:hypothetical protein